jgi:ribokinase
MPTLQVIISMNSIEAKVIGFGALNLDRIFYVDRIIRPDEEGFIRSVENHPGGSAANTIVGLSRLGVPTGYIGKVAEDEAGRILLEDLAKENVNINGVKTARGRSGTCLIMVDGKGNRGILVDPGVNDTISMADIDLELANSAKLIHITSFACRDAETSFETQKELAASTSAEISLDPGTLYAERGMEALMIFIQKARVVLPSDHELTLMTGCRDIREGADMLIDTGAKWVVVKRGDKGCYVTDGSTGIELPPQKVDVEDTTGAGDAFNAGFIYSMLQGKDIETCGKIGNITASISLTKRGARNGLLYRNQMDALIP